LILVLPLLCLIGLVAMSIWGTRVFVGWISGPDRRRSAGPAALAIGAIAGVCMVPFAAPFFGEIAFSKRVAGFGVAGVCLVVAVVFGRKYVSGGPALAGAVFFAAVWAYAVGYYVAHAVGWQGLSIDHVGSREMGRGIFWLAPILWSPLAFAAGFFVGIFARIGLSRPPAA
jgi:hypothetical protein